MIRLVVSLEKYLKKLKITRKQSLVNNLNFPTAFFVSKKLKNLLKSYASFCANLGVSKEIQYRLGSFFKDIYDLKIPVFGIHTLYIANHQLC